MDSEAEKVFIRKSV